MNTTRFYSFVFILLFFSFQIDVLNAQDKNGYRNISDMTLDQLMNLEFVESATLGKTSLNQAPSTITVISRADIEKSGARRVTELLEIFIPNFQYVLQDVIPWQIGLRGIMSNDKQAWLVNGKSVIQRTSNGISPEFDLPMLTDINYIEVVRGPGSSLHGPGALGMVINIVTNNYDTFNGGSIKASYGVTDELGMLEIQGSQKIGKKGGLYGYIGLAALDGVEPEEAPMYAARSIKYKNITYSDTDNTLELGRNYQEPYNNNPKAKAHLQYKQGALDVWGRFTQGGEQEHNFFKSNEQTGYGQANLSASYHFDVGKVNTISVNGGFTNLWLQRNYLKNDTVTIDRSYNEYAYDFRITDEWQVNPDLSLIGGASVKYELFGRKKDDLLALNGGSTDPWETTMSSLFAEANWAIASKIRLFAGARYDWHTFAKSMFSPRASLVYLPNQTSVLKLMVAQSARINSSNDMRLDYNKTHVKTDVEMLKSIELRYDYLILPEVNIGMSVFYHDLEPLSFNTVSQSRTLCGVIKSTGGEFDLEWRTEKLKLTASHSFTKLLEFEKVDGAKFHHYSTAGTGIGNDFSYWNNHSSKLAAMIDLPYKTVLSFSTIVLWGSPGGYNLALTSNNPQYGGKTEYYTLDDDSPFTESVYMNIGFAKYVKERLSFRADFYNVLELANENLNKRWIWNGGDVAGGHRIQPFSIRLSASYRF